jgi:hypothetical protein
MVGAGGGTGRRAGVVGAWLQVEDEHWKKKRKNNLVCQGILRAYFWCLVCQTSFFDPKTCFQWPLSVFLKVAV